VFWTDAPPVVPPSACAGVGRSAGGEVVGWTVETEPALVGAVDLVFVEGAFAEGAFATASGRGPESGAPIPSVVITRCLRDALFGGAPALGRTLHSNRFPPARIAGVIEDVRMRIPVLYHTQVTALFVAPAPDERVARYLVRVEPGRADAVAAAIPAALGGGDPDHLVTAGLFTARRAGWARVGVGTVVILAATTAALGIVAILGNLAIAAFVVGERRRIIGDPDRQSGGIAGGGGDGPGGAAAVRRPAPRGHRHAGNGATVVGGRHRRAPAPRAAGHPHSAVRGGAQPVKNEDLPSQQERPTC
jgi:hypothetical protein